MINKMLLVFLMFPVLMVHAQENFGRSDTFRKEIASEVDRQLKICDFEDFQSISELETIGENFQICEIAYECEDDAYFKTYKIESYDAPTVYQELYFTEGDVLVFAQETELSIFKNDTIQWNCKYFFENGKLVDLISHGHGKTEDENWNPELIIKKFQDRLAQ